MKLLTLVAVALLWGTAAFGQGCGEDCYSFSFMDTVSNGSSTETLSGSFDWVQLNALNGTIILSDPITGSFSGDLFTSVDLSIPCCAGPYGDSAYVLDANGPYGAYEILLDPWQAYITGTEYNSDVTVDANGALVYSDIITATTNGPTVPEPGSMELVGLGLLAYVWFDRKRRKAFSC